MVIANGALPVPCAYPGLRLPRWRKQPQITSYQKMRWNPRNGYLACSISDDTGCGWFWVDRRGEKVDVDKKITGKADHGKKMWHLICWNDAHGVAILILIALLGLQILTVIRS